MLGQIFMGNTLVVVISGKFYRGFFRAQLLSNTVGVVLYERYNTVGVVLYERYKRYGANWAVL